MVMGLVFDEDQHVLLIRKARGPTWMRGLLNGLGGHIEPKESPPDAMARENEEECGIATRPESWICIVEFLADDARVFVFVCTEMFEADDLVRAVVRTSDRDEPLVRFPVENVRSGPAVPQPLVHDLYLWIPLALSVLNGMTWRLPIVMDMSTETVEFSEP